MSKIATELEAKTIGGGTLSVTIISAVLKLEHLN